MLLNILKCREQCTAAENYLAQNASGAVIEKPTYMLWQQITLKKKTQWLNSMNNDISLKLYVQHRFAVESFSLQFYQGVWLMESMWTSTIIVTGEGSLVGGTGDFQLLPRIGTCPFHSHSIGPSLNSDQVGSTFWSSPQKEERIGIVLNCLHDYCTDGSGGCGNGLKI